MLAREAGDWEQAKSFAAHLRVEEGEVAEMWWQAMQWGVRFLPARDRSLKNS